jgi:hypothetical protein
MTSKARAFRKTLVLGLSALLLAGGAASPALARKRPPPPPPPAAPPPEPEIPVGQPVLASYVIDSASAFATYMRAASALSPVFTDGGQVANELRAGSAAEQHQMQQGLIAYAAIVALQDPTFVEAVRHFAHHASTRDQMVRYILDNPAYVMTLDGHDSAAQRVAAALGSQALRLKLTSDKIKQESLDIQLKAAWSKKPVPDPAGRLAAVKQLSATPIIGADDLKTELSGAASGSTPLPADPPPAADPPAPADPAAAGATIQPVSFTQAPYTEAVARGMAIAALAVLGKASDGDLTTLMPLMSDAGDSDCFNIAKLNLYQCLAVAKPYYEDIYCLGLHATGDIGRCVMKAVGMPEPVAAPPPAPAPTKAPTHKTTRRRRH